MHASDIIKEVGSPLLGLPVFIAGSLVAEETYGLAGAHDDADIFCASEQALFVGVTKLLGAGFTFDQKFERVWQRWIRNGLRGWHTNSIKLHSSSGIEVNMVFKTIGKKPTSTLSQVLESFDFGLLATGYDLERGTFMKRDMRDYLFPGYTLTGPLPLMPSKRQEWLSGFISSYNGMREPGRYAKYTKYGYDMSLVKDDLVTGYEAAALYYTKKGDEDALLMSDIYMKLADHIRFDHIDELKAANGTLLTSDALDDIMKALE